MKLAAVRTLLQERLGFGPEALGTTALDTAVRHRMKSGGWADTAAYAEHLAGHDDEFEALVDEVVVPETWFFRGGGLFAFLATHVRGLGRPARVLSVPCSTGEEPYSIAIALHEAGVPRALWSLTAADVSRRHLEAARRGRYGAFAFRQTDDALRARHFRPASGGWQINAEHRDAVRFVGGNLIDPLFLAAEPPFDVVLCRNLLIYLHAAARRQVLANLARLLAPEGLLAVGHAEPQLLADGGWQRFGPEGMFLFSRRGLTPVTQPSLPPTTRRAGDVSPPVTVSRRDPAVTGGLTSPARPTEDLLALARRQADAGQLADALGSCRAHLDRHGPSAALFSLQGAIHQARHETAEAVRCFEKALYLSPDHRDALLHLMLLASQQGDAARAALLRKRLDRTAPEDA